MKRTMLMAAAIWALGSVTAYAENVPDNWTPGTHTTPVAPPAQPSAAVPSSGASADGESEEPVTPPEPVPAPVPEATVPEPVVPVAPAPVVQPRIYRVGASVLLGGGFEDFTNNTLQNMTGGGGAWNARLVAGTRQFVGLEAAYVGSARSIEALGLDTNSNLVANGLEGALRVNVPVARGISLIEPFGFVGVGWEHYNLTNTATNTSDILNKDDVLTLPYGGGLAFAYGMFMADARFTYRQTYLNDMLAATGSRLNTWGINGSMGVEF